MENYFDVHNCHFSKQEDYVQMILEKDFYKKYYIQTFGCQMNEHDSEKLAGIAESMGYIKADGFDSASLIILNTCCIRETAEQKVFGHLGALKSIKAKNPDTIVAVCGCMTQQKETVEHITKKYKHVDIVFGTHNLHCLPEMIYKHITNSSRQVEIWNIDGIVPEGLPVSRENKIKAWVTIMYGCNNFCTYCVVPYVRGRERSRKPEEIIKEIKTLSEEGYKEVTLLGQNVNSYGKDFSDNTTFANLLREIGVSCNIERLRFMTSHPKDLSDELIFAMRDVECVCNHIHLPIQSGSSKILEKMNRKYTKEQYIELVEKIRVNIPDISITTDIIVGFPGETEEDFLETLDVVEKVKFDFAYMFLYSSRINTPASKMENQIPDDVKQSRLEKLLEIQNAISKEKNENLIGKELKVLVEGTSKTNIFNYTGRTTTNKIVNFKGHESLIGKTVDVKITDAKTWSLEGQILKI